MAVTAPEPAPADQPTPTRGGGGARWGMTVPFDGIPLSEHGRWFAELEELGYTDLWSAEVDGGDGFTPLALASVHAPTLNLGIAIAPAYTRGPALLAQTAASLADAAPGRFAFGLGTSSDVIVERWNGIPFTDPYVRVRDTLRFMRAALTGEKVDMDCASFTVKGFRLSRVPAEPPQLYLAALRGGMLRLAGREADGAIINWLSAEDVRTVVAEVHKEGPGKTIVARIFVCPTPDPDLARMVGKRMIAAYLNVRAYAEFHRWLGRGDALGPMWEAWGAGDRKGALAAIPDSLVDELVVHGTVEECRAHVQRYVDNGVDVPALAIVPVGMELADAVRGLAPQG